MNASDVRPHLYAWAISTKPHERTVEEFDQYLRDQNVPLFGWVSENDSKLIEETFGRLKLLAELCELFSIEFRLTSAVVDALLRPRRGPIEYEAKSYRFFIETCLEHDWIKRKTVLLMNTRYRLQILPVICIDGNLIAWIFDPVAFRVYRYYASIEPIEIASEKEYIMSRGTRSTCTIYLNNNMPQEFLSYAERMSSEEVQDLQKYLAARS